MMRQHIQKLFFLTAFLLTVMCQTAFADDTVTRGEFAGLINEAFGFDTKDVDLTAKFSDIPNGCIYERDMAVAKERGYMKGFSDGTGRPKEIMTGAEAAVIATRLLHWDTTDTPLVRADMPAWALPAYSALDDLGILKNAPLSAGNLTKEAADKLVATLAHARLFGESNPYGLMQVRLQDDFYRYANRAYLATGVVHPGSVAASSFADITQTAQDRIMQLFQTLHDSKASAAKNTDEWKMRTLYEMYLDTDARTQSIHELQPYVDDLNNVQTIDELMAFYAKYDYIVGGAPFIAVAPNSDKDDPSKWCMLILQEGLGLPDPYYYKDDALKSTYTGVTADILNYMGATGDLQQRAEGIYTIEKHVSEQMLPVEKMSDVQVLYTPTTWDDLKAATPNSHVVADELTRHAVFVPMPVYCPSLDYVRFADGLYTQENLQALKDLTLTNIFNIFSTAFGDDVLTLKDPLRKSLYGSIPEKDTIEVRAVGLVNAFMTDAISKLYVKQYCPERAKQDVIGMVNEIKETFESRLLACDWLADKTKQKAVEKLKTMKVEIGYPDTWEKSLSFDIGETLVQTELSYAKAAYADMFAKLEKPCEQSVWTYMTPTTVNAAYIPSKNTILFPAAIMQAPFYDVNASREENLGGIGVVIGHEITHAFDKSGSQFDKDGKLNEWWTEADRANFEVINRKCEDLLSQVEFLPDTYVNGENCVGEATADLGGLECVLDIAKKDPHADLKKVMTSFAHVWAERSPTERVLLSIKTDPHPPNKTRVNLTLSCVDDFYKLFHIERTDAMYLAPEKRIKIW